MKSCENCRFMTDDPPCMKWDCYPWESAKYWKPDYPTLERENAELKERVETLERISHELDRITEIATERHGAIIDENERIERALEQACEWFAENVDCRECPLACTHRCIGDPAGCKATLIRYFKEAAQ
jgi:hypothetical protein